MSVVYRGGGRILRCRGELSPQMTESRALMALGWMNSLNKT